MTGVSRRGFMGLAGGSIATLALASQQEAAIAAPASGHGAPQGGSEGSGNVDVVYPQDLMATSPTDPGVLDVKKLFGAIGDGVADDTDALIAAYDAVINPIIANFKDPFNPQRIIYLPNGTYKVSRTIIYSHAMFRNANNPSQEGLADVHFVGQTRDGVVIKLADGTAGFEEGADKPVVSYGKFHTNNNVSSNLLQNLTIDVGSGNPGAVGVRFTGANFAAIRNVVVKTSGSAPSGSIGIAMPIEVCQAFITDVEVDGFDVGVTCDAWNATHITAERLTLTGQAQCGVKVSRSQVALRRVKSIGSGPAIQTTTNESRVVLLDSELSGDRARSAIVLHSGSALLARNVSTQGYGASIKTPDGLVHGHIVEYSSNPPVTALPVPGRSNQHHGLPIEERPAFSWPSDVSTWASVNSFGAVGDGVHDDTASIRAAMASGSPVIYFRPGMYRITSTIDVPSTVRCVNFMYTRFYNEGGLRVPTGTAYNQIPSAFRFMGRGEDPALEVVSLQCSPTKTGTYRLFEHASRRKVILRDVQTQRGSLYWNSVDGGSVIFESTSVRTGRVQGAPLGPSGIVLEGDQRAWAWQLNAEHAETEIQVLGAKLWVLGSKKEGAGQFLACRDGADVELLGGVVTFGHRTLPADQPIVNVADSAVTAVFGTTGLVVDKYFWTVYVDETEGQASGQVTESDLPPRGGSGPGHHERYVFYNSARRPGRHRSKLK